MTKSFPPLVDLPPRRLPQFPVVDWILEFPARTDNRSRASGAGAALRAAAQRRATHAGVRHHLHRSAAVVLRTPADSTLRRCRRAHQHCPTGARQPLLAFLVLPVGHSLAAVAAHPDAA